MRPRFWFCAAVALQSILAFADSPPAARDVAQDGRTISEIALSAPSEPVNVIVRFRDTPLFARRDAVRLSSNARAEAMFSFDARFATFDRDLARIDRELRGSGLANAALEPARVKARYSRTFSGAAVTLSGDALDALTKLDYVHSVHLDRPIQAYLDRSVPKIGAPQVWATYGTRGKGVVVAVLDTGIDYNHAAFGGGFGPGHRVIGGWDVINNDADPIDDAGHGTHVAGIIGGNGGGITGVAPEVSFLAYKVLSDTGSGSDSTILGGIERAADPNQDGNSADHADVANMSLGRAGNPDDPVTLAVETAISAGVIFCIATGNAGAFQAISTPANAPSAISVGATTLDDQIATFSSKGPVNNTMAIKPEVVAPGVGIVSAKMGGGTLTASGTSMATPHIAGVAALLRALHKDWPAADIKAAIVATAEPLGNDVMAEGAGRVNALRAASADVVATPATLSLGRDDVEQPLWTVSRNFTLVNHGTTPRTLTLSAPSPRAGITITLTATSATLAAGESRQIGMTVAVDNAQVPSSREGSLAIGGAVTITGGAMPLHLPWAFVKAAVVTIDYDGIEPFEAYVASTNSLAYARLIADINQHKVTATVPAGEYDLKMIPFILRETYDNARRVLLVERVAIENAVTIPVRKETAAIEIGYGAKDERGRTLDEIGRGNGTCQHHLVMAWPQGSALAMSSMPSYPGERFLMTQISDRFTLMPFHRCLDFNTSSAYSGEYETIRGITASFTMTIDPSEWVRTPVRVAIPESAVNPYVVLAPGWTWHGAYWWFTDAMGAPRRVTPGTWTGAVFTTRSRRPGFAPINFVQVEMDPPKDSPPSPFRATALRSLPLRVADGDTVNSQYLTTTPATYAAEPGEVLPFGEGLARPESSIWMEGGEQLTTTRFYGALDELREVESLDADLVLRNESGAVVASAKSFIPPTEVPVGAYRFELTKPGAKVVASFDSRRADGAPPVFTALRLLDGNGRITSRPVRGEAASLLFAAIDRIPLNPGAKRAHVATEATRVRWKAHGATAWNDLPVTITAQEMANGQEEVDALGHIPVGTVFRANLSAVTNAGAATIDLSIRVEDASGNSYEYTMEPAFTVQSERRRNTRH